MRNEGHVIKRCLDNIGKYLDAVAIVDTGSNPDDTCIAQVEQFIQDNKLPGSVLKHKYGDFGVPFEFDRGRNAALRHAESVVKELSIDDPRDLRPLSESEWESYKNTKVWWYFMFMDIDNQVFGSEKLDKEYVLDKSKLVDDCYSIKMGQASTHFEYIWLVKYDPKGRLKWKWTDPLHEWVSSDNDTPYTKGTLDGCYMLTGREGDRNKNPLKYLEDALVFERLLVKRPDYGRGWFYLGQSYRDARRYEESLKAYLHRAEMESGWKDERVVSYIECGKIKLALSPDRWWEALNYFNKSIELDPNRLEAVYFAMEILRNQKMFGVAWNMAKSFINVQQPDFRGLFIDHLIHTVLFNDSASVCAYYSGDKASCLMLAKRCLECPTLPPEHKPRIENNIRLASM